MGSLSVGPFVFSSALVVIAAAALISLGIAKLLGKRSNIDVKGDLFKIGVVGVITARIAYVVTFFDDYRQFPWSMIDLRDGGFVVSAGLIAAISRRRAHVAGAEAVPRTGAIDAGRCNVLACRSNCTLVVAPEPKVLPAQVFASTGGQPMALTAFTGKPLVINLWATWCPPCRVEMPVLAEAQARNPDIGFIFVNRGETVDVVQTFLKQQRLTLENVLLDDHATLGRYAGSDALPTTLFFDAHGILIDRRIGDLSAASLAARTSSYCGSR